MALQKQTNEYYLPRYIDEKIDQLFTGNLALYIDGPRGVGKTSTAKMHVDQLLSLDIPEVSQVIDATLPALLQMDTAVCIDEWQEKPELWNLVRHSIDDHVPAKILLTGSSSPTFNSKMHSGAGRFIGIRMRPMGLAERPNFSPQVMLKTLLNGNGIAPIEGTTDATIVTYIEEMAKTGFPGIFQLPQLERYEAVKSYIDLVIQKDFVELLNQKNPQMVLSWWASYAAASSTTATHNQILEAANPNYGNMPSLPTARAYRDILKQLWMLDPVPAWLPNIPALKGLTLSQKHQVADPGIAMALLGVHEADLLNGSNAQLLGQLFEALATLCVRAAATTSNADVYHLRTQKGTHEIDLIVKDSFGKIIAIEVKVSSQVKPDHVKHLHWLKEKLGDKLTDMVILNCSKYAYRRPDGIAVVPLALFG